MFTHFRLSIHLPEDMLFLFTVDRSWISELLFATEFHIKVHSELMDKTGVSHDTNYKQYINIGEATKFSIWWSIGLKDGRSLLFRNFW